MESEPDAAVKPPESAKDLESADLEPADLEPANPEPADLGADDPVARTILELIEALAPGRSMSPVEAARSFALTRAKPGDPPDAWRRYLPAVRQQALNLARRGRLTILRKGKPVDPHAPFKGVVRLTRPDQG
jgi:hypothetical protein